MFFPTIKPGNDLFGELRTLGLPTRDYAVFGSGPLAVRGLIREIRDLDLVARGAAWERAKKLGPVRGTQRRSGGLARRRRDRGLQRLAGVGCRRAD